MALIADEEDAGGASMTSSVMVSSPLIFSIRRSGKESFEETVTASDAFDRGYGLRVGDVVGVEALS